MDARVGLFLAVVLVVGVVLTVYGVGLAVDKVRAYRTKKHMHGG